MSGWVAGLAARSVAHPLKVVGLTVVLAVLSVLRIPTIELFTSNLDLIDPDLPEVHHFLAFTKAFGTPNALVVAFEGEDSEALRAAVDTVAPQLRKLPEVRVVLERPPYDAQVLRDNGLDPYLCNDSETLFFIFVQPRDDRSSTSALAPFVAAVQRILDQSGLPSHIRAGLTGIPKYALDDQNTIQGDMTRLSLLSLVLIVIIFSLGFPSIKGPVAATLTLLASLALCVGFISLTPGHLTLLSAMFASMICGLGIDYGIHIVHHVEALCFQGLDRRAAIIQTFVDLERPLNVAVATTSGVFLTLIFSGFHGFAELGYVAGTGILICYLMMVSFLPALLVLLPHRQKQARDHHWIGKGLLQLQRLPLGPVLLVLSVLVPALGWPQFDGNYLNLQPANSSAVQLEQRIHENSDLSPYFAAFVCADRDAARTLADQLRQEPSVADARALTDLEELVPEGTPEVPAELRSAFVDAQGRYAVYAYPAGDVWNSAENRAFIQRMREIDPGATGMPFLGEFMIQRSKLALERTALLSLGVLLLSGWFCFRAWRPALLAMVVPILTVVWLAALMKLTGQDFNPLNVMAIPIILGIAIDDGVVLIHQYQETGTVPQTLLRAGHGVVLTSLTTMAAFGSVMFSDHRGLRGFSFALFVGVGMALLLSVTLLPWLLARVLPKKAAA